MHMARRLQAHSQWQALKQGRLEHVHVLSYAVILEVGATGILDDASSSGNNPILEVNAYVALHKTAMIDWTAGCQKLNSHYTVFPILPQLLHKRVQYSQHQLTAQHSLSNCIWLRWPIVMRSRSY